MSRTIAVSSPSQLPDLPAHAERRALRIVNMPLTIGPPIGPEGFDELQRHGTFFSGMMPDTEDNSSASST